MKSADLWTSAGRPSHAYLFHGPSGSGKGRAAEELATALLSARGQDADAVRLQVLRRTHPDLTWVLPSGASEILVSDIDEAVVAAASRTPFLAAKRVFVIEGADVMGERPANMLLKTLEEPPPYLHLILLARRASDVLPTVLSRCQLVRFDPLPVDRIEAILVEQGPSDDDEACSAGTEASRGDPDAAPGDPGASRGDPDASSGDPGASRGDPDAAPGDPKASSGGHEGPSRSFSSKTVAACARLCLGEATTARSLLSGSGAQLRFIAQGIVRFACAQEPEPVAAAALPLLEAGRQAGERARRQASSQMQEELEMLPQKERRRREREGAEAARRRERRARTEVLDLGLRLVELMLRDLICIEQDLPELIHNVDELVQLRRLAAELRRTPASAGSSASLAEAVDIVAETRMRLRRNVSEGLAVESMLTRLRRLLRPSDAV